MSDAATGLLALLPALERELALRWCLQRAKQPADVWVRLPGPLLATCAAALVLPLKAATGPAAIELADRRPALRPR